MEEEVRLLTKKATSGTTEIPALNVQSRVRSVFARESVYSSAKRRFSSQLGRERIRHEGEYPTPRSRERGIVSEATGKTRGLVARISFVVP